MKSRTDRKCDNAPGQTVGMVKVEGLGMGCGAKLPLFTIVGFGVYIC